MSTAESSIRDIDKWETVAQKNNNGREGVGVPTIEDRPLLIL